MIVFEVPVQLEYATAASTLVKPIDVLRDDRKRTDYLLELCKRDVCSVGNNRFKDMAAVLVPLPNALRICQKPFHAGQLFWPNASPQSIGIAKRRHSTFGRDTRSC
jgi:hypothetical protein